MPEIKIAVINKVPKIVGDIKCIVADNSDYTIRFTFDDMWDDGEKTVYFVRENGFAFPAAKTKDDTVKIPTQHDAAMHSMLFIGVQQGNVKTSRPVDVRVTAAITDMIDDDAVQPDESLWESVILRIEELEKNGGGGGIGMLTVNATANADGTLTTDYSSAEIIEHINSGGDTRLRLESGVYAPLLGIEDVSGVVYAFSATSAEAVVMNMVLVVGNNATVTLEEYNPENAGFATKEYAYAAVMTRAAKPVTITVDLAEDNSFVIPDHTAEELLEMAQNGEVRLTAYRANEDGSVVLLMADIHGDIDTNDGVLYTMAADMQITSVPVLVLLNTSNENTNGTILETPAAGASSSGGALNLQYYGAALTDITLSRTYTYDDVRAALLANRPITLTTYSAGGGETRGMFHVIPGASVSKDICFIGFEWTTNRGYDDETLPDLGWTPKSAVLAQDGTLTFEDEWFEGYAKQAEVDSLSKAIDERYIPTYTLAEGEMPEDAPEWAEEVIDPYNDPEGGGYILTDEDKQEIAEIAAGLVDLPDGGGSGSSDGMVLELIHDIVVEESVNTMNLDMRKDGAPVYWRYLLFDFVGVFDSPTGKTGSADLQIAKGYNGEEWAQWSAKVVGVFNSEASNIPTAFAMQYEKTANGAALLFAQRNNGVRSDLVFSHSNGVSVTDYEYIQLYFPGLSTDYNIGAGTKIKIWGIRG